MLDVTLLTWCLKTHVFCILRETRSTPSKQRSLSDLCQTVPSAKPPDGSVKEESHEKFSVKKGKLAHHNYTQGELEGLESSIINGEKLSDMHINFSQCILKNQFPNLKGFQSSKRRSQKVKLLEWRINSKLFTVVVIIIQCWLCEW